jgi:DNA-directed RNA polymerase specialized sigma24 family protein
MYTIARNESYRFYRAAERHQRRRESQSEASEIAAQVRTATLPFLKSAVRNAFAELRETLEPEDRAILVLRLDRDLAWEEIVRVLSDEAEACTDERLKRESARLRKRFETIKRRLTTLAQERGLLGTS